MSEARVERLYDALSRQVALRNRLRGRGQLRDLTMHKHLDLAGVSETEAAAAGHYVDELMIAAAGSPTRPRVLDAGCGFGASVFHWHARLGGEYDGLTLSEVQLGVARERARARGIADACRFHKRSYDSPQRAGHYDVVMTIESLVHSDALPRTIANLATCLGEGGRLLLMEDMWTGAELDASAADRHMLVEQWGGGELHPVSAYRAAIADAGLELVAETDLSERVRRRDVETLARLERRYRRWLRLSPRRARPVVEAYLGGIALERLYRNGLVNYRLLVAARP